MTNAITTNLDELLAPLEATLTEHSCVILQAEPGAGKTTRVPLALLEAPWLVAQKILMLEPRRLAARSAARYMAHLLGQEVGQTVGYSVRLEQRVSAATRLEVVTEGILTRRLQADPTLEGVGLVIFDEFHERSLQADLGLALCLEVQQALREDLRLLIMSATLDSPRLAAALEAPVLQAAGRQFPVELRYQPPAANQEPIAHMVQALKQLLNKETGSVLCFLPGEKEIRRVAERLQPDLPADVQLAPLYGNLSPQLQDLAIAPAPAGQRKVVLATNLAETSLTIEGIRVVVDSGQERVARFDPVSGMSQLVTQVVSQASAVQRQGRAGRLEPGLCLRLWHESDTPRLPAQRAPEILSADLAPLVLELALWGSREPQSLFWLNPPDPRAFVQAQQLLQSLGLLAPDGAITAHGKAAARLPLHPRLSHMVLSAHRLGLGGLAASLAALLSERDLLGGQSGADLSLRLEALAGRRKAPEGRRQHILALANQIAQGLGLQPVFQPLEALGELLALAYPDRLAQRRPGGPARFVLNSGRGAFLPAEDALAQSAHLAVAHLDGDPREARIFLAAGLSPEQVAELVQGQTETVAEVNFESKSGRVSAEYVKRFGAWVLERKAIQQPDQTLINQALLQGVRQLGLSCLPWSPAQLQLRARSEFIRQHRPDWPDLSEQSLLAQLEDWLAPFLSGIRRLEQITPELLQQGLDYALGYEQLQAMQELAPSHWEVPSGSRIRLDYSQGPEPVLAVRIQELFGLAQTPAVLQGQVPLLIHLLSPAQRPMQVTRDLASFWQETYPLIKKELKGRYPKHAWPDEPLQAQALRGVKRKNSSD